MEELIKESTNLYYEIDDCITKMLKAKLDKDADKEREVFCEMSSLLADTMQHISWLVGILKQNNVKESINYWMSKCASLQQEIDVLNEKLANTSAIKWQTETPCEECLCLVTLDDGSVKFDLFTQDEDYCGNEVWGWANNLIADVIAWCKLSDIKPYQNKEETK